MIVRVFANLQHSSNRPVHFYLQSFYRCYYLYFTDIHLEYHTMVETTKPTIVFVPGAWQTPEGFDTVREQLETLGFATETVSHLSTGGEAPLKGLADDSATLRAAIEKLADAGKDVVVAAHSYGGVVSSNATEGLALTSRAKEGRRVALL